MRSLAGTLDALRPHLPVALVSAAAFDRARAAVDHLEPEVTNGTYFECRLQSGSPRVDLVVIVNLDGGRRLAATGGRRSAGALHEPPGWGSLLALCRQWTTSDPALRDLIDHIWLEYDVEHGPSRHEAVPTAPGVFCSLRRSHRRACSAPALCRKVLSALEALTGRLASYTVRECLSDCCARLPLESGMPHVGFMAGRKVPAIRVCIAKLPAADAAHFLAATAGIGGGTVAEIVRLASLPDGPGGPLYIPMLHLDMDERHGFVARVGMERQFPWICQLTGRLGAGEHTLLDVLTARGLCTRDKRDALLEWPGRSVAMMPHEIWWSVVERRVNHVKFVYEPESGVEAKGYLFARHRPCRRRRQPFD